jgi:hypothetical protein
VTAVPKERRNRHFFSVRRLRLTCLLVSTTLCLKADRPFQVGEGVGSGRSGGDDRSDRLLGAVLRCRAARGRIERMQLRHLHRCPERGRTPAGPAELRDG